MDNNKVKFYTIQQYIFTIFEPKNYVKGSNNQN